MTSQQRNSHARPLHLASPARVRLTGRRPSGAQRHYDLELPGVSRKSDAEWRKDLKARRAPPRPEWTRGYLVPGVNEDVGSYVEPRDRP